MSPLGSGPTGFLDGQRTVNYDQGTPLLCNRLAPFSGSIQVMTNADVSRYAWLAGYMTVVTADAAVTFSWSLDPAGAINVGQRTILLSRLINGQGQVSIRNLGPYVSMTAVPLGGGSPQPTFQLYGTNRPPVGEWTPHNALLADIQNQSLLNGATFDVFPSDYWAGPMQVSIFLTGPSMGLQLFALNASDAYDIVDGYAGLLGSQWNRGIMVAPTGAWKLQVSNGGAGAANFYLGVIPSLTGST